MGSAVQRVKLKGFCLELSLKGKPSFVGFYLPKRCSIFNRQYLNLNHPPIHSLRVHLIQLPSSGDSVYQVHELGHWQGPWLTTHRDPDTQFLAT